MEGEDPKEPIPNPENPIIDLLTTEFSYFIPYGMPKNKKENVDNTSRTASATHPYIHQFYRYPNTMRELHDVEGNTCQNFLIILRNMLDSPDPIKAEQGRFLAKQLFQRTIDNWRYLIEFRKLLKEYKIPYYNDIPHDENTIKADQEHKKKLEEQLKTLFDDNEDQTSGYFLSGFSYNPDHIANLIDDVARIDGPPEIQSELSIHTDWGFNTKGVVFFKKNGLALSLDLSSLEKSGPNNELSDFPRQNSLNEFRQRFFINSEHMETLRANGFVKPKENFTNPVIEEYVTCVHTPYGLIVNTIDPTTPKDKAATAIRGIRTQSLQPREVESIYEDLLRHIQFDENSGVSTNLSVSIDKQTERKNMILEITAPEGQYVVTVKDGKLVITHNYSKALAASEESYIATMTSLNRLSEIIARVNQYLEIQTEPSDLVVGDLKYIGNRTDPLARVCYEKVRQPKTEVDLHQKSLTELLTADSKRATVQALGKIVSEYGLTDKPVPPELIELINGCFGKIVGSDGRLDPNAIISLIRGLYKNSQLLPPIEVPTIPVKRIKALSPDIFSEKERQTFIKLLQEAKNEMNQFRTKKAKEYLLAMGDEAMNFIRTFTDEQLAVMFPDVFRENFHLVDKHGEYMDPKKVVEELLRSWNGINPATREALLTSIRKLRVDIDINERFIGKGYVSEEYNYLGTTSWFDLIERMDNVQGNKRLAGSDTLRKLENRIGETINKFQKFKETDLTVADKLFADFLHNLQAEKAVTGKTYLETLRALKNKNPNLWNQTKQLARATLFLEQFILGKTASQNTTMITPVYETINDPTGNSNDVELCFRGVYPPLLFAHHLVSGNPNKPIPYGVPTATSLGLREDRCVFISGPNMSGKSQIIMTCLAALSGAPLPAERESGSIKVRMKKDAKNECHSFITSRDNDPSLSTFQNEAIRLLRVLGIQWGFLDEPGGGATATMQEALQITLALLNGSVASAIHNALPIAEIIKTLLGNDEEFNRRTAWYTVNPERQLVPGKIAAASGGIEATKRAVMPLDYLELLQEYAGKAGIPLQDVEPYKEMAKYLERVAKNNTQFITDADLDKLGYAGSSESGKRDEVHRLLLGLLEEGLKKLDLRRGTYEYASRSSAIAIGIMETGLKPSIVACLADDQRQSARGQLANQFIIMLGNRDKDSALTHNLSVLMMLLTHIMPEGYPLIPLMQDLVEGKININEVVKTAEFLQKQEFLATEGSQGTKKFLSCTSTIMTNLRDLLNKNMSDVLIGEIEQALRDNLAKKAFEAIKKASLEVYPEDDRKEIDSQIKRLKEQIAEATLNDVSKEFLDRFFSDFDEGERKTLEAIFQRVKQLVYGGKEKAPEKGLNDCLINVFDQKGNWWQNIQELSQDNQKARREFELFYQVLKRHTTLNALSKKVADNDVQNLLFYIDRDLMDVEDGNSIRGVSFQELDNDKEINNLLSQLSQDKMAILVARMIAVFHSKEDSFLPSKSVINNIILSGQREDLIKFRKFLQENLTPSKRMQLLNEEINLLNTQLQTLEKRRNQIDKLEKGDITEGVEWILTRWAEFEKNTEIPETRKAEIRILVKILRSPNILEGITRALNENLTAEPAVPTLSSSSPVSDFVKIHDRLSYFGKDLNQILIDVITKPTLTADLSETECKIAGKDLTDTMTIFAFCRLFHTLGQDVYCLVKEGDVFEFTEGINLQTVAELGNRWASEQIKKMSESRAQVRMIPASEIVRQGLIRFKRTTLKTGNQISVLTGRNGGGKSTVVRGAMGAFVPAKIIGLSPAKRFVFPKGTNRVRLIESRTTGVDLSAHMGGIVEICDALWGAGGNTLLFCDEINKGTSHQEELVENWAFLNYCLAKGIKIIFINHDRELVEGIKAAHPNMVGIYGIINKYKVDKTDKYVSPGSINELRNMGWPPKTLQLLEMIYNLVEKRKKLQ